MTDLAAAEEVLGDVLPGPADTQLSSAEAGQQNPDVEEVHDANTAGDIPSNSDVKKEVRFDITGGSNDAAGNDTGQADSSDSIEKKEIGAEVGSDPSEDHGGEVSSNDEKEDDKEQSKLEELRPNDPEADDEPEFSPAQVPKWKKGHARMTNWDEAQWLKYFADKRPESEKEIDYMPNESDKGSDSFSADGVTELHRAAYNGWSEVVLAGMLDIKFDIEGQDQWGKTPLYYAAKNGKDGTVRFLLDRGADIESKTGNQWTALHAAARAGHDNVIEVLLKHDPAANINTKTSAEVTPLFLAVFNKRKSTVELFLKHGAEQGARNENKDTMLHIAASKELPEILTLLLEYTTGAEFLNDKGKQLLTQPLDTTDEMIIKLRREKIMDINDDGENVFDAAFDTWSNGEMLAILLRCYCPRLELPVYDPIMGYTLLNNWLFKAVSNGTNDGSVAILKSKIGPRLDLDMYVDGKTMLHLATQNGNLDVVQGLLHARAEIDAATEGHEATALHLAAYDDNDRIVRLLLKEGANFTKTNKQGLTALRFAELCKAYKARDLLLNPPPVEGASYGRGKTPLPAWLAKDDRVCTMFDAFMVNFYSNKSSDNKTSQPDGENFQERVDWLPRIKPVNKVIYEDGPKKIFEEAQKTVNVDVMEPTRDVTTDSQNDAIADGDSKAEKRNLASLFTWIHIPANNIVWIKDLLKRICKDNSSHDYDELVKFVFKEGIEHKGSMIHSRYMKSGCWIDERKKQGGKHNEKSKLLKEKQPKAKQNETGNPPKETQPKQDKVGFRPGQRVAIYMPFLNFESQDSLDSLKAAIHGAESTKQQNRDRRKSEAPPTHTHDSSTDNDGESIAGDHDDKEEPKEEKKADQDPEKPPMLRRSSSYVSLGDLGESEEKCKMLVQQYLNREEGHLHLPKTLSQFYYHSIDTELRDKAQVVYKFSKDYKIPEASDKQATAGGSADAAPPVELTREGSFFPGLDGTTPAGKDGDSDQTMHPSNNPKLFMVDQLWLWIIDDETIITSFPQRWAEDQYRDLKVLEYIQTHLGDKTRPQVSSVYEMAALITSCCMKFVDHCRVKGVRTDEKAAEADEKGREVDEDFFQVYSMAITNAANKETALFKKFGERIRKHGEFNPGSKDPNGSKSSEKGTGTPTTQPAVNRKFGESKAKESIMNAPSSQQINPGYSLQSTKSNAGNARTRQESVTGAVPENASQSSTTRNAFMVAAYGWIQKGKQVGSKSSAEGQNGTDEGKPGQDDDDKPNDEADIYGEIENLKEIRDIRDELIILRKLLTEQTDVAKKLFNTNLQSSLTKNTDVMDYYSKRSGLDTRIRELDNMEEEAERIYNLAKTLLNLRQKQANIDLAERAARQQELTTKHLEVAGKEQKEVLAQGRTLLVFTFVTIVFLPMSFLTSLYALNVNSFPHNDAGDLSYEYRWIFSRIIGIPLALGVIFAVGFLAVPNGPLQNALRDSWDSPLLQIFRSSTSEKGSNRVPPDPPAPINPAAKPTPSGMAKTSDHIQDGIDPLTKTASNQPSPGDRRSEDVPPDSKVGKKASIEGGEGHPEGKSAVHFTDEKIATANVTENGNRKELPEEEVVSGVWGLVGRLPLFRSRKGRKGKGGGSEGPDKV